MKTPHLGEKKNRYIKGFYIFTIVFSIIWISGFLLLMEPTDFKFLEILFFIVPGIIVFVIGLTLYVFFNRQIVSVIEEEGSLTIYFYSGKKIYLQMDEISQIHKTSNRYIFYLESGKHYSAYKYMPPTPMDHAKKLETQISALCERGILPGKEKVR